MTANVQIAVVENLYPGRAAGGSSSKHNQTAISSVQTAVSDRLKQLRPPAGLKEKILVEHEALEIPDWWLRPDYSRYSPAPPLEDFDRYYRYYIDDANLALDFFRYSPAMKALMRECLRFKAEHNLKAMGLLPEPVFRPDAGARVTASGAR